jgi:GNAT superfamily N-acetyltransferase
MTSYYELNSKSPEFSEAYALIMMDIDPEFVEPEEYIRSRFRVQENGAKTDDERRMIPEGYSIRMIVGKDDQNGKIAGVILTNFVPKIGKEWQGFALVGYLAVLPEYRRKGIATRLVDEAKVVADKDSIKVSGKPTFGFLFEIEDEEKDEVEQLVLKLGGYPLEIDYYQPSVREGYPDQPMNLWLLPFSSIKSLDMARNRQYATQFIHDMVKSLFVYEYPGQDKSGFKEDSKANYALVLSTQGRASISFMWDKIPS